MQNFLWRMLQFDAERKWSVIRQPSELLIANSIERLPFSISRRLSGPGVFGNGRKLDEAMHYGF